MSKDLDVVAAKVESPIEEMMFWAILGEASGRGADLQSKWHGFYDNHEKAPTVCCVSHSDTRTYLSPQRRLSPAGGSVYRVDFVFLVIRYEHGERLDSVRMIVECDGHDFHERTKEQAKRDKKRDRQFQTSGFMVARFTGSEVFNDARGCARQLFEMVAAQQEREQAKRTADAKKRGQ
jgi:very-short-patch-repair endonuclease